MRASPVHKRSDSLTQITNVTDNTFPEFKPLFGKSGFGETALFILEEVRLRRENREAQLSIV